MPTAIAGELEPILRERMTVLPRTHTLTGDPDVRGDAASALESMRADSVTDSELWNLILGSPEQRVGAAQVLAARRRPDKLDALTAIASDSDSRVHGAVANLLVGWLADEPAHDTVTMLLRRLVESGGMSTARAVAAHLHGTERNAQLDAIATLLRDHASAFIRRRIDTYFAGTS